LGDDRKTVLKFAVNAKQISTPLLDWANRLWIEGGWKIVGPRGWVGKWQTTAGEKGKHFSVGERQLCFQLICSELHLALHWQIGCFGPPRSSRIRRRIFGGRGRRRRALGGILVNQRVAEVPTPSSQHPAPSTRRPR